MASRRDSDNGSARLLAVARSATAFQRLTSSTAAAAALADGGASTIRDSRLPASGSRDDVGRFMNG